MTSKQHARVSSPLIRSVSTSLARRWRVLVATDLIYKIIAFVVLAPMSALLWRCVLTLGGANVLSDTDIVAFFAGPFGWLSAIVLGGVWLATLALEQSSLLFIVAGEVTETKVTAISAIRFALIHAIRVLRATLRIFGWTLLIVAPFLLMAVGVYVWLLSDFDINYYLNERPTEFKIAIGGGVVLVSLLGFVLLRLYSAWFLALPLILFDGVAPREGLSQSKQLVEGNRRTIIIWLVIWLAVVGAANLVSTAVVGWIGQWVIPPSVGSVAVLAGRVGFLLFLISLAGLVINLFAAACFAGLLNHAYLRFSPSAEAAMKRRMSEVGEQTELSSILTWPRLAVTGVIAVLVSVLIGLWALGTLSLEDKVEVMAHRGASKSAPENTMAAFEQAIAAGADWIEIDVQETADGEVVVMHDSDFMKVARNPLKIWNATLEDLEKIDIGSWMDPKFSGERVPTLTEVLRLCRGKVGVNIELKYYGHDEQLEQRVVEIVEQEQMVDEVMIMSLKPNGIAKTKSLRPDWKCGLLLSVHVGDLNAIQADFLAVNVGFATRSFVKRAHQAGKEVYAWTINDAATMSRALNDRVDGILTDRPELARDVLKQRSQMSSAERLLSELALFFRQPPPTGAP